MHINNRQNANTMSAATIR